LSLGVIHQNLAGPIVWKKERSGAGGRWLEVAYRKDTAAGGSTTLRPHRNPHTAAAWAHHSEPAASTAITLGNERGRNQCETLSDWIPISRRRQREHTEKITGPEPLTHVLALPLVSQHAWAPPALEGHHKVEAADTNCSSAPCGPSYPLSPVAAVALAAVVWAVATGLLTWRPK
jgi:hypothetical protein